MPLLRLRRRGNHRRLLLLGLIGGALGSVLLVCSSLSAKPGLVTAGGQTFEGDIDEVSKPGSVIITTKEGAKVTIDRRSVDKVQFFDTPQQEFEARLGALDKKDVAGRITLAQSAIAAKHYDMAREALASAKAIEPNNAQVAALIEQVNKESPVAPPPTTRAGEAGHGPTTRPGFAKRQVTPEEINQIRQMEWRPNDFTVKVRVPPDVRKQFIDTGALPAQEVLRLTPIQLANAILQQGSPALRSQVQILNDPVPMVQFRQKVQRTISTGCATCHSPDKAATAGHYVLYPGDSDAAAYSNFLILQKTALNSGGVEREMVNRTVPDSSLILLYLLPPELVDGGHPKAPLYHGAIKNRSDPRYAEVLSWIKSLSPLPPNYDGIDLTTEPKGANAPHKATGRP